MQLILKWRKYLQSTLCFYILDMALVGFEELWRYAIVGDRTGHKITQDVRRVGGVQDQVGQLTEQEIKCWNEKKFDFKQQAKNKTIHDT